MKKFLTVLLALSVVFTYTVGTAFAATPTEPQAKLLTDAYAYAQAQVNTYYEKAYSAVVKEGVTGYTVKKAAWDALPVKAELDQHLADVTSAQAKDYTATGDTYKAVAEAIYLNGTAPLVGATVDTEAALMTWIHDKYDVKAALNQYNTEIADACAWLDNVDYSLYSTTTPEDESNYEKATKKIADAKIVVRNTANSEAYKFEAGAFSKERIAYLAGTVSSFEAIVGGYVKEITIPGTEYGTGKYEVVGVPTIDKEAGESLKDEALAASYKAAAQVAYATYITDVKNPDKEFALAWLEAINYLADEGKLTSAPSYTNLAYAAGIPTEVTKYKTASKNVAELKAYAEKYKAEKDASGNLVRDSKTVDKIVKKYAVDAYGRASGIVTGGTEYTLADAKADIAKSSTSTQTAEFDFAKKVRKTQLEKAKANAKDDYYPAELEKLNAAYDAAIAKVDAAKAGSNLDAINADLFGIDNKTETDKLFNTGKLATEFTKQADALRTYIDYKNYGKTILDPSYNGITDDQLKKDLIKFYGEQGARSEAAMKALATEAQALVDKLPTNGQIKEAKTAVETAIKAIPAKVTSSDKATIEAAWKALVDYAELTNKTITTTNVENAADLNSAVEDLYKALRYDMALKVAFMDKADKAALKALQAEFDALNDLTDDEDEIFKGKTFDDSKIVKALADIRATELKAVKDAINAIPLNITDADRATIEKARMLYDAYVAEYTDSSAKNADGVIVGDYAAGDVTNFRTLALAEATLGITIGNKAVESLKITASSKAGKGYIKVTWKVKGDAAAADGYQVFKSTKRNSGFGTKPYFTTKNKTYKNTKGLKKGTRYYYKVRAYKVVDGKTYYSDWSNKAYRIAK